MCRLEGDWPRHLSNLPLKTLYLGETEVMADDVARLQEAMPELKIIQETGTAPERSN